jgi:hypothetical protein
LLLTLTVAGLLVLSVRSAPVAPPTPSVEGRGDSATYSKIVQQMRGGSSYYVAAHEVLITEGYGTNSVFNWRTPVWPVLISLLPSVRWVQGLLAGLTTLTALLIYRGLRLCEAGPLFSAMTALVLIVGTAGQPAKAVVFTEYVAGILILLSIAGYVNGWNVVGAIVAIAALFIRELVAVYVLVCLILAFRHRDWAELRIWIIGLIGYGIYFLWHWTIVANMLGSADRGYPAGWLQFGGLPFVLETAHFSGLLVAAPVWISALILPIALLGLVAWPAGCRAALTVTAYLLVFAVIGKPFNIYWGAVYAPLLMLGLPPTAVVVYEALSQHRLH